MPRSAGADGPTTVSVDGHRLAVTNLDKVLYPAVGTTKAEVLRYYALAAPALLPVLADRPVTRKRWPNGVDSEPFFVKNTESGAPAWVRREVIAHSDGPVSYPLADSVAVLTWMAQMAALELHVPQWRFVAHTPGPPDRMVFDLDPGPGVGLDTCARVALVLREVVQRAGADAVPVTSGSKGLHLYVPLDGSRSSDQVSAVAKAVAEALEKEHPDLVTSRMAKSLRPGKVFLDWSQNSAAKTTIAPYSLRGREFPTVAAPRSWDEIAAPDLAQLDLHAVLERLADGVEPWRELFPAATGSESGTDDAAADPGVAVRDAVPVGRTEPDAAVRSAAAAYALAMTANTRGGDDGHAVKYGSHRWADPTEGPRGRVVRREVSGRRAAADGPASSAQTPSQPSLLPMLATAGSAADVRGDGWRFEAKWDGIRAVAHVDAAGAGDGGDGTVRLIGRSSRDLTGGYPELAVLVEVLAGHRAVLDGEIVTVDADGRTSFPLLQQRMNVARPSAALLRRVPVRYFAFDVLEVDGISLLGKSYDDRRRVLAALLPDHPVVEVPPPVPGDLDDALRFTGEQGWEGIVAKRADSVYRPGTRSGQWIKIKHQRVQEVVVIGWRPGAGRRSGGIGSLLLAVGDDDGTLRYCGRVGTGFTDSALETLRRELGEPVRLPAAHVPGPDARQAVWVEPQLVGEVAFVEWTPDGRLRAPSWRGVRPDKDPPQVRRES